MTPRRPSRRWPPCAGVVADRANFLVVLERSDALTWLSLRNAVEVHIVAVDQVNTYDVLASRRHRLHPRRVRRVRGWHGRSAPVEGVRRRRGEAGRGSQKALPPRTRRRGREKPAEGRQEGRSYRGRADDRPRTTSRTLPKGAKAPLKSGGAPKGYEVKGNADSGLFHEPDGQWYDATEAEFYFKTAEDAEAAGFTRAGGGQRRG